MTDILEAGGAALAPLIRAGEVSAEEVMRAHLDRIAEVNDGVTAIVSQRDPDDCLAEARAADASRAAGEPLGPLHGLPIAIKDLTATKGLLTTMGSPLYADLVPNADSPMVARIRAAGALIVGKTNTPEFGLGSHTMNPIFGATKNPWDRGRSAGGSSGGAAVALAMRMLPIADGSDQMGSLRNPAGWNNVFGFRPSWGRVANDSSFDLYAHQLSTEGPMGRSVADMALLLDVQAGYQPEAPLSHGKRDVFVPGLTTEDPRPWAKGLRIGWIGDWNGGWPMEPGILETCEAALKVFESLGAEVVPLVPDHSREEMWDSWTTLRHWGVAARSAAEYENPERRKLLKPEAIWEIEHGLALSAMDIHRASVQRARWHRKLLQIFESVDLLAMPSAQVWPFPVEERWPQEIAGVAMDTYHRWMECVLPTSLGGRPAVCVPAGFGPQGGPGAGLPMGLQLMGAPRGDLEVLRAAAAFEAEAPWTRQAPPA